jgi:fructoselysine-6-P-deglycase FrlB-like protein
VSVVRRTVDADQKEFAMPKFLVVLLIAGVGVAAYIAGAKAGESRYADISDAAKKVWNDPGLSSVRKQAYKKVEKAAKRAAKKLR